MPRAHLHALVDLYPPVVVIVQLFVDVSQRLQTEAVGLAHARRHHYETGVCRTKQNRKIEMRRERLRLTKAVLSSEYKQVKVTPASIRKTSSTKCYPGFQGISAMLFTRCILGTWRQHIEQNVGYSANKTKSTPGCYVVKRANRDRAVIFIFSERNEILFADCL